MWASVFCNYLCVKKFEIKENNFLNVLLFAVSEMSVLQEYKILSSESSLKVAKAKGFKTCYLFTIGI